MLILSRQVNQTIMIGDDVQVTLLSINVNQVHIGIKAPRIISVHREEVYRKIKSRNFHRLNDNAYKTKNYINW